ncbi:hypothetical protein SAMN05421594_1401 [Chryseobacterium oleae]|uniref:Uncharacterized protein n=1 Tax=Chryseobacterium oleae TaxID=491207 RepID=A0A1I4WQ59_CHROL|nr:hypothetical protein [Chryseobacterium oleae]SFN15296.1 hypothetical protein SAMN05421594_1401 [Chryseobacterium oleae]
MVGGAFAGAAIGQGISNINVYGTKFIANSVIGSVGSIFNGIATGQNIFKSALIGFSGINYSFNLSDNDITFSEGLYYNKVTSRNISNDIEFYKSSELNAVYDHLYYDLLFRTDGSSILKEQLRINYKLDATPDLSNKGLIEMVTNTPELNRLFELGEKSAIFHVVKGIPSSRPGGVTLGETFGTSVMLSKMGILTNLDLGLTIGHEFVHVYHNVRFRNDWMRMYNDTSGRKYKIISEIEAHTWSERMGDPSAYENLKFYNNELKLYKIYNYKPKNTF